MSARSALERGRAKAESLMVDRCTIRRETGTVTDPDTGAETSTYEVLYPAVVDPDDPGQACRVQSRGYWGEAREVGQAALVVLRIEVQLPIAVTGLRARDEITIDTSVNDPELEGLAFRLSDLNHKSHATMRRVMCTEVTG